MSGILMAAGMLYGYTSPDNDQAKEKQYRLVQHLALRFKAEHESLLCRDLLGLSTEHDSPTPDKWTDAYYQARPCADLVARAAEIFDDTIQKLMV